MANVVPPQPSLRLSPPHVQELMRRWLPASVVDRLLCQSTFDDGKADIVVSAEERFCCDATHVNSADEYGTTPLHFATKDSSAELVRFLLAAGADVHAVTANEDTALSMAAQQGHDDVLRLLHQAGADVNHVNVVMCTPAHLACYGEHLSTLRLLHSFGAYMRGRTEDGVSVLDIAASMGNVEIVDFLTGVVGLYVNSESEDGWTPLLRAASSGSTEVVKLLHSRGAHANQVTVEGYRAAHFAAKRDNVPLIAYLHGVGADIHSANGEGATPLAYAAWQGSIGVVRYLVSHGADVNAADIIGRTPIHAAAERGREHILQLFAACDAGSGDATACSRRFRRRSVEGLLPYHVARTRRVQRLLRRLNAADDECWR